MRFLSYLYSSSSSSETAWRGSKAFSFSMILGSESCLAQSCCARYCLHKLMTECSGSLSPLSIKVILSSSLKY